MKNEIFVGLKLTILFTLLLGGIYPLLTTFIAQVAMPHQANGSFIYRDNTVIGSTLIGQKFTSDKYFWGRPSATDYSTMPSGASNLSLTNPVLQKQIQENKAKLQPFSNNKHIPSELIFASGSGVDPHISIGTAYFQIPRIVKARPDWTEESLERLIEENKELFFGKTFVRPYINVLKLNMALDEKKK